MSLTDLVKNKRKLVKRTQPELAEKAGAGRRFMRELEQGKTTLRLDKVNQVLQLFGDEVGAVPVEDVTMHLAQIAKLKTVTHSLIRLQSGNLA